MAIVTGRAAALPAFAQAKGNRNCQLSSGEEKAINGSMS